MIISCTVYIDGPDIVFGPTERAGRSGDPFSILCGSSLDSNPEATVTWSNPSGIMISDTGRFNFVKNLAGDVMLELTTLLVDDMGVWSCVVTVQGTNVTLPSGDINIGHSSIIGSESLDIMIHVVGKQKSASCETIIVFLPLVAPGAPVNVAVDSVGPTWIFIRWNRPCRYRKPWDCL